MSSGEGEPNEDSSAVPPASKPPVEPTPRDRLAERIDALEANLAKVVDMLGAVAEKQKAQGGTGTPKTDRGIIGEIFEFIGLDKQGGGGDVGGEMFKTFYLDSHKAWDKLMIANLKKAAGIAEEAPHMEVTH